MEVAQIIGALIGAAVGWLICVLFGPKGHFERPNYWVWDTAGGLGCLGQLGIILISAFLGTLIATLFAQSV